MVPIITAFLSYFSLYHNDFQNDKSRLHFIVIILKKIQNKWLLVIEETFKEHLPYAFFLFLDSHKYKKSILARL